MMNRTLTNALQILTYLALQKNKRSVPLAEISAQLDASPTYLAKVASMLSQSKLIHSQRGISGGMRLQVDASQIRLSQIWEACQSPILDMECHPGQQNPCALHTTIFKIRDAWLEVLSRWTLADLLPAGHEDLPTPCVLHFASRLHAAIAPMELP